MQLSIHKDSQAMARRAADDGAGLIRRAIAGRGNASVIFATGASQIAMLEALTAAEGIDWHKVTAFHLDEYIGLRATHPASFRHFLRKRIEERVTLKVFHFIHGDAQDLEAERRRIGHHLASHRVDVAFIGVGENAHIAFNDPPARFEAADPYLIVDLDEACRRQQVGEGWFASIDEVPRHAITMSVPWILRSDAIICTVPDERKARAVRDAVEGPVTPDIPASALQRHHQCTIYLDEPAASLLARRPSA